MRFKASNDYFESQNSEASSENNAAIYSTQMQDCLDSFHIFSHRMICYVFIMLRIYTMTSILKNWGMEENLEIFWSIRDD